VIRAWLLPDKIMGREVPDLTPHPQVVGRGEGHLRLGKQRRWRYTKRTGRRRRMSLSPRQNKHNPSANKKMSETTPDVK